MVVTGLILRWGAHGAALAGGGFEGGEFKVGGEEIGELVGGAVDGGGHVGGCLRRGRRGGEERRLSSPLRRCRRSQWGL